MLNREDGIEMESSVWMIIPTNVPNHHKQNFTDYLSKNSKEANRIPVFFDVIWKTYVLKESLQ